MRWKLSNHEPRTVHRLPGPPHTQLLKSIALRLEYELVSVHQGAELQIHDAELPLPSCLPDNLVARFHRDVVGTIIANTKRGQDVGAVTLGAQVFVEHGSHLNFQKHILHVLLVV
jgi:hypothetical protein